MTAIPSPFFREGIPTIDAVYAAIDRDWIMESPMGPYSADEPLDIVFESNSASTIPSVPSLWLEMLRHQESKAGNLNWKRHWGSTLTRFPAFDHFLNRKCIGIGLEKGYRGVPALLYFAHGEEGNLFAYRGPPPLKSGLRAEKNELFDLLPRTFQTFYSDVHNGFGWLGAPSNLPYSAQYILRLSTLVSDRDISPRSKHKYKADAVILLADFNAAGNMFAFDSRKLERGYENCAAIYWHETPAEVVFDQDIHRAFNELLGNTFSDLRVRTD